MKIGVVDYGAGNLGSIRNAFASLQESVILESNPNKLLEYDRLILPGVGAFGDVMEMICKRGFDEGILEFAKSGRYVLGICLGMQLLFEKSYEFGEHKGLGLLNGEIRCFKNAPRTPHIGWNQCFFTPQGESSPILKGIQMRHIYILCILFMRILWIV